MWCHQEAWPNPRSKWWCALCGRRMLCHVSDKQPCPAHLSVTKYTLWVRQRNTCIIICVSFRCLVRVNYTVHNHPNVIIQTFWFTCGGQTLQNWCCWYRSEIHTHNLKGRIVNCNQSFYVVYHGIIIAMGLCMLCTLEAPWLARSLHPSESRSVGLLWLQTPLTLSYYSSLLAVQREAPESVHQVTSFMENLESFCRFDWIRELKSALKIRS